MKNIAIFASGSGSNAENIFNYFADKEDVKIALILTNNKNAFVIERAKNLNVPLVVFNRYDFYDSNHVMDKLKSFNINFIVLAGFLWLIPNNLIDGYKKRIVNIHPALLPKYGGKGMYGMKVHEAVKEAKETETGITIHYVNHKYDEGEIIFQAKVNVEAQDSAEDIASKIHLLEYEHFPRIIESII